MTGTIDRLHTGGHTGSIQGDDGRRYYLYRTNLATLQPYGWEDLRVGWRVAFSPAESGRTKDDPRAIEVDVIETVEALDGS